MVDITYGLPLKLIYTIARRAPLPSTFCGLVLCAFCLADSALEAGLVGILAHDLLDSPVRIRLLQPGFENEIIAGIGINWHEQRRS
jgi:hypothetical protein